MVKHCVTIHGSKNPNGEVSMKTKTIRVHKFPGWMSTISRVLIFTMILSLSAPGLYMTQSAEAAITYQSAGTIAYSAANGTSVDAAYPAAISAGDLLVMIIGMKPSTANSGSADTPTGWVALAQLTGAGNFGTTLTADQGNTNIFSFYKVADGTESGTVSVTLTTNNVSWAQIYRYSKSTGEWQVAAATGADTTTTTGANGLNIPFNTNPGVTAGDQILGGHVVPTDSTTPAAFSAHALSQTGISAWGAITEIGEPDTTNGNDLGGVSITAAVNTGTATGNPTWTATVGGSSTAATRHKGAGVFIRMREAAGTPPTAGTVNVTPSSGGFTSGSPTITTDFTDNESPVTSCQYTTNGSTWNAGTVSGSMPTMTCTANPVGLSGSVTINMRATSGGGTGTAIAVPLTVDTTAPTGATIEAIAGNAEIGLSWSATDGGGIASFKLVRATGATAPANCASGTVMYNGPRMGFSDTTVVNATQYSYRVCATDNFGNANTGVTVTATPSTTAARGKNVSCAGCHAYPPGDGTRSGATGSFVGDHQKHQFECSTCHVAPATESSADFAHRNSTIAMQASIASGSYSKTSPITQVNNPTTGTCSNIACHGGNNPTPQWGVGTASCVDCHSGSPITRTKGEPGATLDPVMTEFGLAWGHKKSGRAAATAADCIVCHLEGNFTTQATSTFHANGYIDLRDPDGANGEILIKDISGSAFQFTKFSTSYSAGSRTWDGHTLNTIDNVLTQKFCLACHDANGATNNTARSNNGGTGTATMPFGGVSTGYSVADGAAVANGLVNVKSQFTTTNSSVHPVMGSLNRDFPSSARLAAPYNNNRTRPGTSGTKTLSVVINCFDCHNTPGTPLTTRTIVAHGYTSTPLRGTVYTASYTLCGVCHTGYTVGDQHGAGSAMASATGRTLEGFNGQCYSCHGDSGDSDGGVAPATVRPRRGQNYHGFNTLVGGGTWPTTNSKPYGFIRNTATYAGTGYHRPLRGIGELATGTATCTGGTGCAGNSGARTYTPGGQY